MAIEGTLEASSARRRSYTSGRSTAMWVIPVCAVISLVLMLDVLVHVGLIPPVVVSAVIIATVLVATLVKPGSWSYLASGIGFGLVTAANAPILVDGFLHPITSDHQWKQALALGVLATGAVAGFASFNEARRGRAVVPPLSGPVGESLVAAVAGLLVGASVIGLFAYGQAQSAPSSGIANGVTSAPAQPPVELAASNSKFLSHSLMLGSGSGTIYVVNKDAGVHTFDIALNGRHYSWPIPASSTVAVVLPLTAGKYTYYCAIAGHRANGMEGTLSVP